MKAVSWRYDFQVVINTGPSVYNLTEIIEITQSGRCYKLDNLIAPSSSLIMGQWRKNERRNVNEHCKEQDVEISINSKRCRIQEAYYGWGSK